MKPYLTLLMLTLFISGAVRAQIIQGTYAIQNVATGKNLRPYEAGKATGNKIVLYNHHSWKCLTWRFLPIEGNSYQLENLYTAKTLDASAKPVSGVSLWQQPLQTGHPPAWEFVKQADQTYLIRLKGTELYVSTTSDQTNSAIVLLPNQSSTRQRWKLIEQDPWL